MPRQGGGRGGAGGPSGPAAGVASGPGGTGGGTGLTKPQGRQAPLGFEFVSIMNPQGEEQFDLRRLPPPPPPPLPPPVPINPAVAPAPAPADPAAAPAPAPAEQPLGDAFLGAIAQSAGNTRSNVVNPAALTRARQAGVADDNIVTRLVSGLGADASRIV